MVGNPSATAQEMIELAGNSMFQTFMPLSPPPTDPVGLVEMMDPSSNPSGSAERPEDYIGFNSFVKGNTELGDLFFEWCFKNWDHISPEKIKAIKFRRSTIEWASKSFGKTKLLKMLLVWVEHNQFGKRPASPSYPNPNRNYPNPNPSPNLGASSQVYSNPMGCGYAVNPYLNNQQFVTGIPLYWNHKAASKDARRKRMAIIRLKRHREDAGQGSGTVKLQLAMGNRGTVQSQISGLQKDYKFLLQKLLVQSDVGNGRMVLPKREAERHLPELEKGDKITIEMEEVGTSRIWSMCYRFWHNNINSRMYILEKTGEYVRENGLRAGDLIVLYLDTKRSKYMISYVRSTGITKPVKKAAAKRKTPNLSAHVKGKVPNVSAPVKRKTFNVTAAAR